MNYIVDSVINYIKHENTNYAVLINGRWGSGKTFFWENVLRNEIESIDIKGKKQRTIYVSLYGITSQDEISRRIFMESFSRTNGLIQKVSESKWGGRVTELGKMAIGYVKTLGIPGLTQALESGVNFENLVDFTDTVLCFDDLERANIEITDIMGYINNFVEHDGVKVIIISNENEISEKLINRNIELRALVSSYVLEQEDALKKSPLENKNDGKLTKELIFNKMVYLFGKTDDYKRIKEKLIGKTLSFVPDNKYTIEAIVTQVSDEKLKTFLIEHLDLILRTFERSGTENIRILKQALDDFSLVFSRVIEKCTDKDILSHMLIFTLAASFEIKSGKDGCEKLARISSNDNFMSAIYSTRLLGGEEVLYEEEFSRRYFLSSNYSLIFYKFIEILVRMGVFNIEVYEQEMEGLIEKLSDKTPVWLKFIKQGYWELTDEEFEYELNETYSKLVVGEVNFILYFKAFLLFRSIIQKGLFNKSISEIKAEFLVGLEKSAESSTYYNGINTYFWGSKIALDDCDAIEFKDRIFAINNEKKSNKEAEDGKELIGLIETDFYKFVHEMQETYFYRPVFVHCDVEELCDKIISLTNEKITRFSHLIKERYIHISENEGLRSDFDVLEQVKNKINSYIIDKKITLKLSLLIDLKNEIDSILEHQAVSIGEGLTVETEQVQDIDG